MIEELVAAHSHPKDSTGGLKRTIEFKTLRLDAKPKRSTATFGWIKLKANRTAVTSQQKKQR